MDICNLADESVNIESARPFRCTVYREVNLKISNTGRVNISEANVKTQQTEAATRAFASLYAKKLRGHRSRFESLVVLCN